MRLGVKVGKGCEKILDQKMQGLNSKRIEVDEFGDLWREGSHLALRQARPLWKRLDVRCGGCRDQIGAVLQGGKWDAETANAFVDDLSLRLTTVSRFQRMASPCIWTR